VQDKVYQYYQPGDEPGPSMDNIHELDIYGAYIYYDKSKDIGKPYDARNKGCKAQDKSYPVQDIINCIFADRHMKILII